MNGDGELTSQGFKGRQQILVERAGLAALQIQHTHDLVADQQGHSHFRAGVRQEGIGAEGGAGGGIGNDHGVFFNSRKTVDRAGIQRQIMPAPDQFRADEPGTGLEQQRVLGWVGQVDLHIIQIKP